ncbi:glycosyltransferase [Candidatus Woesebacteria bacterium]|nr:glycosyltransferase [Candidatus Woesebacteria bacterium]MCD8507557.1 glycosyltransferase [Candidatus Woesebacteria bacterium]MCD8527398.1 glycosyltransferase [Candidatus Woesebacteria bacterium]MCD8546145.1 glycosyltransferase [Candidatus Woesebacteria bacterium]
MRKVESQFSVVVPVSNDLSVREYAKSVSSAREFDSTEHVFVQNGVSDAVRQITDEFANDYSNHRNIQILEKGIQISRNIGISQTSCEWIVNLDSDVQVNRRFFEALRIAIEENPGVEVLVPRLLRDEGQSFLQRMTSAHFTNLSRRPKPPVHNPGLVVRRTVYEDVGLLDTRFKNGNDNDFKRRIKGKKTINVPGAVVFHKADPDAKLMKQHFKYGRDRSRISRHGHPEDRKAILGDRISKTLLFPKFIQFLPYGFKVASYETVLGFISAAGFWYQEGMRILGKELL